MHSAQSMTIGMCTAGLPGIDNVNLASHTMGEGKSRSWWSRGPRKAEKPTQGAPARAQNPTPAAKMAPSGAHSAKNAQVSSWRTRPITWPSRRAKLAHPAGAGCVKPGALAWYADMPGLSSMSGPQVSFKKIPSARDFGQLAESLTNLELVDQFQFFDGI